MRDDVTRGLRDHNRERVLQVLRSSVAMSRSEIAQRTGLSRTTVADIVGDLLGEQIIRSSAPSPVARVRNGAGRPPELLSVLPDRGYAIALDIAHETVRVAVVGLDGDILEHRSKRIALDARPDEALDAAKMLVHGALSEAGLRLRDARGVVAAIPEPIDRHGDVTRVDRLSRWSGRNPGEMLTAALGMPASADNDANLAVLGEVLYGAARGLSDVIYVKVAHGVGTGIVMNGGLVRGGNGLAGEVGHIQVRPDGMICSCGNRGCLFTLVTSPYLARLLSGAVGDPALGIDTLSAMGSRDEAGARRLLFDAGAEVGKVLANICNTLNPTAVIVGGRLAHAGSALLDGVRDAMTRHAEPQASKGLTVALTALHENAELLGAAAVASGIIGATIPAITRGQDLPGAVDLAPASAPR